MLDVRYSHLYFYQSLNRLQRGLSAIAELLVSSFGWSHQRLKCCLNDEKQKREGCRDAMVGMGVINGIA